MSRMTTSLQTPGLQSQFIANTSLRLYRALKACVAGGSFRRPGEVFAAPAYDRLPKHLEEVTDETDLLAPVEADAAKSAAKKPAGKAKVAAPAQGSSLEEIGGQAKVISSSEITSADIIANQ